MTNHSTTSKNPFDIFIVGLRKGLDIGLYSLLPNVLMAFVLTYMLNLFGVMKFLGASRHVALLRRRRRRCRQPCRCRPAQRP